MSADADTPRGGRVLSKDRMEGFSDGVFGFAITLLVVDIALHPPGSPFLQSTQRKFLPAVIGYVIAILIGLLLPVAAAALYAGLAVYLVVPFREAARVLIRRHSSRHEPAPSSDG